MIVTLAVLRPSLEDATFGVRRIVASDGNIDPASVGIQDFTSHLRMARATWNGSLAGGFHTGNRSIYTPESHLEVVHDWVDPDFPYALPFGYSPTMFWILGPFSMMNDRYAFLLWTLLGGVAVTWTAIPRPDPWKLVFAIVVFLGPLGIWCLQLGQTSFLSTAGFLFLAGRSDIRRDRLRLYWPEVLILWAFTAKPPLAITAGLALLLIHGWRLIFVSLGLTFITTAIVTPWMGPGWISDYVHLLTHYTQEKASPAFAWSLGMITSPSNLRSFLILSSHMGDHLAGLVSWCAWIMALIFLAIGWRGRKLVSDSLWSLAILAMLMFSPHLSNPEDLHAFMVGSPAFTVPQLGYASAAIISAMGLRDHRWHGWPFITICLIAFGLKIVLTALVLWESYRLTRQKTSTVLE